MRLEAIFHNLLKPLLAKKQQGYVMGAFREAVSKANNDEPRPALDQLHWLTFAALRQANTLRALEPGPYRCCEDEWTTAHWMQALVGEVGELANILKKVDRGDTTLRAVKAEVGREVADIQVYLDLLARKLGIDLGAVTVAKFNEVSERIGSSVTIIDRKADKDSFWQYLERCSSEVESWPLWKRQALRNDMPKATKLDEAEQLLRRVVDDVQDDAHSMLNPKLLQAIDNFLGIKS